MSSCRDRQLDDGFTARVVFSYAPLPRVFSYSRVIGEVCDMPSSVMSFADSVGSLFGLPLVIEKPTGYRAI